MHIDDFLSSIISFKKEGKLDEWLKNYTLANFGVTSMDDIENNKKRILEEIETLKNNKVDYESLQVIDKINLAKEDKAKGLTSLEDYIKFKLELKQEMESIQKSLIGLKEQSESELLIEVCNSVLKILEEDIKLNDDIEIAQTRIEELKNLKFEEADQNTITVLNASIDGREKNIEKINVIVENINKAFKEIDSNINK